MRGKTTPYIKSLGFLLIFLVALEGIVIGLVDLHSPPWGDEAHFIATVGQFAKDLGVNTITHYDEMSTPLPFVIYGLWARLFGADLVTLRLLSVVIAFVTYILFHSLLFSLSPRSMRAVLTTSFLALHPYMIGLSVLVFTDMLPILFVVLCCLGVMRKNPLVLTLSCGAGLLCRQYFAFVPLAGALYYLSKIIGEKDRYAYRMLMAIAISFLPLAGVFVLWGGFSPDCARRSYYLQEGLSFHPTFLTLYITQFFSYLMPLVLIRWKSFFQDVKIWTIALLLSWSYSAGRNKSPGYL